MNTATASSAGRGVRRRPPVGSPESHNGTVSVPTIRRAARLAAWLRRGRRFAIVSARDAVDVVRPQCRAAKDHARSCDGVSVSARSRLTSAPVSMLRDFGLPFVKKARDPWNLRALGKLSEYQRGSPDSIRMSAPVGRELDNLVRHLQ